MVFYKGKGNDAIEIKRYIGGANMILAIVDVQEMVIVKELYAYHTFVDHCKKLLQTARENGMEVVFVRHDDGYELTKGVEGFEIFEAFSPLPGERIFDKHVNSAFKESGLLSYLKEKGENKVMIAGAQTEYCIDATIKGGFEHGLEIIVPAYCNTTVDNEFLSGEETYRYYNEMMWNRRYAKCIPFEKALELIKEERSNC